MWDMSNRRKPKMKPQEPELKHSTPEDRAEAGYEIATFEDLDGLTEERLAEIVAECPMDTVDSLSCVPCRAYEILVEKQIGKNLEAIERLANPTMTVSSEVAEDNVNPALAEHLQETLAEALDEDPDPSGLLAAGIEPGKVTPYHQQDARGQIVQAVNDLNTLVHRLMEGPPVPPPDVSMEELAALVLASERWVTHVDRQIEDGFVVSAESKMIYDKATEVLRKVKK